MLKRKIGESLMFGDDIEITFLEKEGDTVKIGIQAPRSVRVLRKEIFDEIVTANQGALETSPFADLLSEYKNLKNDEK
ncbi:carbon storage regulator [Tumebacillus flagellatus]|uniref:carbon storage regulator n=1 Tax=Tumebacillus flagellatus TaxID=1157490 RepID=UPI001EE6606C|nr:carbon storage regulator [Tumebacillus flagellatus]